MTRTPIEPSEIRKGDLIRCEWPDEWPDEVPDEHQACRALEYVAPRDNYPWTPDATHFLLDRPAPAVELPTEPTLGWVDHAELSPQFGAWVRRGETLYAMRQSDFAASDVTAFTPATAVPTEALNMLRAGCFMTVSEAAEVIAHFLAAVDRANGTAS